MSVPWGEYAKAYKAIHDAIRSGLASPPEGKNVDNLAFTYDVDDDIETIVFKQGAETLFTLTFAYDGDKNITSVVRSEP